MLRLPVTSLTVVLLLTGHVLGHTSSATTLTSAVTSSYTALLTTDLTQTEVYVTSQSSETAATETSGQLASTVTNAISVSPTSTVETCGSANFCAGPVPVGTKGNSCACPATYLNIGACCLSQNWIIGLACGSGGVLLIIIILLTGYILAVKSKLDSFTHLSEVSSSSTDKGFLIGAQANHVELDTRGTGDQRDAETVPVIAPIAAVDVEVTDAMVSELAGEAREDLIYDDSGIDVLSSMQQQHDGSPGARQRHAANDSPGSNRPTSGIYDDVAADTPRSSSSTFRARLEAVDPNADYSIRRPTAI